MPPVDTPPQFNVKEWAQKLSRSGYFFAALFLHLILFFIFATYIIFPAFKPPVDTFEKTYLPPPSAPPPPPPPQETAVQVPTKVVSPPTAVISTPSPNASFTVPLPDFSTAPPAPDAVSKTMTQVKSTAPNNLNARLNGIRQTVSSWRSADNIRNSNSDPHNVKAKFPLFLAKYANGDWNCNTQISGDKITAGSLMNFVEKVNQWSHGNITGEVITTPLNIGGPDLMDKKPPFVFFTGHKDFILTSQEIENLRNYLQVGGAIWGDNCLAGRGSRFDVAFRREMKRVVPDDDKNFEPIKMSDDVFVKSWFNITEVPEGMNYYAEPLEHLDIDGKLAILYTPNNYSDMMYMHILNGDTQIDLSNPVKYPGYITNRFMWDRRGLFYRNFSVPASIECQRMAMNIIGFLLVRFDKDLLLAPPQ